MLQNMKLSSFKQKGIHLFKKVWRQTITKNCQIPEILFVRVASGCKQYCQSMYSTRSCVIVNHCNIEFHGHMTLAFCQQMKTTVRVWKWWLHFLLWSRIDMRMELFWNVHNNLFDYASKCLHFAVDVGLSLTVCTEPYISNKKFFHDHESLILTRKQVSTIL